MAVSLRRPSTTSHSRRWIVLGLAAVALLCGRGPLAGAPAQEAPAAEQAGSGGSAESSVPRPAKPSRKPSQEQPALPMISGPRDLLRSHGVDDSHFRGLSDGRPVDDNETETLLKVMFWMRDFRPLDIAQWVRDELDLPRLVEDPEADRGQLFSLSGRVTRVELRRPWPEVVERFELKRYYRCEFILDDRQPAVIFAENVPKQWQEGGPVDERAGAFGLFLKFAGKDPGRPVPVFVAQRMAWYPPTPLGNLGMDVGLLDNVVNRTGLGRSRRLDDQQEVSRAAREREAFYAMLDAVGRAEPGQLLRQADQQLKHAGQKLKRTDKQGYEHFSVVPLFMEAEKQHGRLVSLSGRARRVVRVRVDDADVVARFGIDHYYEISLFTDDSEGNPLVFCVRELPKGMPTGDGPEYSEQVRVAGFFFKLWSYHVAPSAQVPEAGRSAPRQPAPLLIGRRPVWYPQTESPLISPTVGAIAGGLFVLALLGVWLAMWQSGRADKRFHDQTIAKTHSIDSNVSLNDIGLGADGTPDFGGLEGTDGGNDMEK